MTAAFGGSAGILFMALVLFVSVVGGPPDNCTPCRSMQNDEETSPYPTFEGIIMGVSWDPEADQRDDTPYQARVIGGSVVADAQTYRYQVFLTSFLHRPKGLCAGTLISSDVVLTAAHCIRREGLQFRGAAVGAFNIYAQFKPSVPEEEWVEKFEIISAEIHPQYDPSMYFFDFALLKLSGLSTIKPMLLNDNHNIPNPSGMETLKAVGWGVTSDDPDAGISPELREVDLNHLPLDQCSDEWNYRFPQETLCAFAHGKDTCTGDSGGPLVFKDRHRPFKEVQVGVVSFGSPEGCTVKPGVYARVSRVHGWIQDTVCRISDSPDPQFQCSMGWPSAAPSGSSQPSFSSEPSSVPSMSVFPTVGLERISIEITFDRYPDETGWKIWPLNNPNLITMEIPAGTYNFREHQYLTITEHVFLDPMEEFIFEITDLYGDGFCCNNGRGAYQVFRDNSDAGHLRSSALLFSGIGKFSTSVQHSFSVADPPTPAPSVSVMPSRSLAPSMEPIIDFRETTITVLIRFDEEPVETSWIIEELMDDGEYEFVKSSEDYSSSNSFVIDDVPVRYGNFFRFTIFDSGGDGICCEKGNGFYRLFQGFVSGGSLLVEGGAFAYEETHMFYLNENPPRFSPTRSPISESPTLAPFTVFPELTREPTPYATLKEPEPSKENAKTPEPSPSPSPSQGFSGSVILYSLCAVLMIALFGVTMRRFYKSRCR